MGGMMKPWLHFTLGDSLYFESWVPMSAGAVVGACIGLFMLAIIERWVTALRAVMQLYWARKLVSLHFHHLKLTHISAYPGAKNSLPLSSTWSNAARSPRTRNAPAPSFPKSSHYLLNPRPRASLAELMPCVEPRHSSPPTILLEVPCTSSGRRSPIPSCWPSCEASVPVILSRLNLNPQDIPRWLHYCHYSWSRDRRSSLRSLWCGPASLGIFPLSLVPRLYNDTRSNEIVPCQPLVNYGTGEKMCGQGLADPVGSFTSKFF